MTKKISTYKDLIEEKERLQLLLADQKQVLKDDIKGIKEELSPVRAAIGVLKKFTKKDRSNPMLNIATDRLIGFVLNKFVLGRAGWAAKLAVPFLAKNISTHVIADNKTRILGTIAKWINKVRGHKPPRPQSAGGPVSRQSDSVMDGRVGRQYEAGIDGTAGARPGAPVGRTSSVPVTASVDSTMGRPVNTPEF